MNDNNDTLDKIILSCENITHTFQDGNELIPVLKSIDFSIAQGQSIAIMGASGAGKSTLLQLLGGLDNPSSGCVKLMSQDLSQLSNKKRGKMRNQYLGFVYQFHHLLPEFSALENVMMPLLIAQQKKSMAQQKALAVLEKVGLSHRTSHRPAQLSGGERQRAAIARALVTSPSCILADEPTGNLDEATAQAVIDLMLQLNQEQNSGMIIVTHDSYLAEKMEKTYELTGGKLVLQ